MKNISRIAIILLFIIAFYAALYLGVNAYTHLQYTNFQVSTLKNSSAQIAVLVIAGALLSISVIQFAGDIAVKKHISNLIFLLPAILAGVILTCLAL